MEKPMKFRVETTIVYGQDGKAFLVFDFDSQNIDTAFMAAKNMLSKDFPSFSIRSIARVDDED